MGAKVAKTNKNIVSNSTSTTNSTKTLQPKIKISIPSPSKQISTSKNVSSNTPKAKQSISISKPTPTTTSSRRIADKKQKVYANSSNTMETNEIDVLTIIKRNNHDFEDKELITSCLVKHFFMRCLDKESMTEITKEMTLCQIDANTNVFKQGAMGNFFYIVKEGELDLYLNDIFTKTIVTGESFGELALLHGAPRSGSVKTKTKTLVWCLERRNFRKIMDHINLINFEENMRFITSIPILANIDNDLKSVLAHNLLKEYFDIGKSIVRGIMI
jgi:cGMP-dependent protein kinase